MKTKSNPSNFVVSTIALNGGTLAGKTRLQKTIYLIQRLADVELFEFDYHYYGPYSADLAATVDSAKDRSRLQAEERMGYYNIPYIMYQTDVSAPNRLAREKASSIQDWLGKIDAVDPIVLELAATWIFLRDEKGVPGNKIRSLLQKLKPRKAKADRLAKAKFLLQELNLY